MKKLYKNVGIFVLGVCTGIGGYYVVDQYRKKAIAKRKAKEFKEVIENCRDLVQTFVNDVNDIATDRDGDVIKVYKGDGNYEECFIKDGKIVKTFNK